MAIFFYNFFLILIPCLCLAESLIAGEEGSGSTAPLNQNIRRFHPDSLRSEFRESMFPESSSLKPRKSPWLAAVLSGIMPGTGELYAQNGNRSIIKGIGFFAAEATGVFLYFHYKNRGKRLENRYEKFADRNWDVDKYLSFLETSLINDPDFKIEAGDLGRKDTGINYSFLVLAENEWGENSGVSVHHLFENTRQQYYEMIYKYPEQFALGWADIPVDYTAPYPNTGYTRNNLTSMMTDYRGMRVKSNDYLSTARGMTGVIMINHVLSMTDAAWTVKQKNSAEDIKMTLKLRIEHKLYFNTVMTMPTLRLTY